MGDYQQATLFRFTRALFLLVTILEFLIIALAAYNGATPRAIQTSILTTAFIISSLLLFRSNKLDWFMNMVLILFLFQTALTSILVHIEGLFNYNYLFYGAIGYFFNYLEKKNRVGFFWLAINVFFFIFAGVNSYMHWVGRPLDPVTEAHLFVPLQVGQVVFGIVYSGFVFYFTMQYFEAQRSQISEREDEVNFLRNLQQTVANFTQTPVVVIKSNNNRIIFSNHTFSRSLGYVAEELIGKKISTLQTNPEQHIFSSELENILDVELLNKNGKIITRDVTANVFNINDKEYQAIFFNDSSLRKEEEKKLRGLIDNLPVSVTQVGKEGEVIYTNQFLEEITGFSLDKIPNVRSFLSLVMSDDAIKNEVVGQHKTLHQLAMDTKTSNVSSHFTMADANGNKKYINSTIVLFEDYDVFILQDITEERTRQERLEKIIAKRTRDLRNSEQKLRAVLNSIPDGISYRSVEGIFLECNEAFAKMVNKSVSQIIGQSAYEVYNREEIIKTVIKLDEQVATSKKPLVTELNVNINGRKTHLSTIRTPFFDTDNNILGVVNLNRDVTDLHEIAEKERELNKMKSQFITMASHQFKTPLTAILASTELLDMYKDLVSEKLSAKINRQVKRISTETKRLNRLMNDVLILGKVESQTATKKTEETDLIAWAQEIIENQFSNQPDGRTIEMTHKGTPQLVKVDNEMLSHVLSNLFSNALKYSPNQPDPQFRIIYMENKVIFKVQDFGIGIPEAVQSNLFQPFFRANNVGSIQGTGIGLVVVKEFVNLHGGDVRVSSTEHQGTTFTVSLPIS